MSKGVRIYVRYVDGAVIRRNYNVGQGLNLIAKMNAWLLDHPNYRQVAVGHESGAMTVHYKATRVNA